MALRKRVILALLLIAISDAAYAYLVHGINTTFDPNRWGGASAVACLTAAVGGTCSTGFNAACDGVTDDTTAWNNFINYAIANDPVVLYIPPGKRCTVSGSGFILSKPGASLHVDGSPIKNLTIWAYGAYFNSLWIGTQGVPFPDNTHHARLATTHVNDTTLTLLNSGDASRFTANVSWILVSCLSTQRFGYPPNWYTFEYHLVTGVAGSTLTLDSPLKYACKSTYPLAGAGDASNSDLGGPATAYVLNAAWNSNIAIYGLTVTQAGATFGASKTTTLVNFYATDPNGISPSMNKTYTVINSEVGSPEFDKSVETTVLMNVTASQLIFQSASFNNVTMTNVVARSSLNGTPTNAIVNNLTTPQVYMGPLGYGHGGSFTISNSSIAAVAGVNICIPPSAFSYNSGTFTMVKSGGDADTLFRWAIPGQKYYFATSNGTNNSSPHTQFTITDFREDASNYYVDTDIPGALPTPTCGGIACVCYTSYPASSVTQTNTGPADLTPFAAP